MVVRRVEKKPSRPESQGDTVTLSPELLRIREMIKTLPPEGEDTMVPSNEEVVTEAPSKKKVSTVKKKSAKAAPAKAAKKSNGAAAEPAGTTLADICKGLKLDPRAARRTLRNADSCPEVDGARWTWTKAADVERVKKLLTPAK